jgi:glycosyltransferase involved in cell wall biosynthesis
MRSYQYLPYLNSCGFDVTVSPMFGNDYVTDLYAGNISIARVIKSYLFRIGSLLRAKRFDLVWVEKEMLPWLPSWIELGLFPSGVLLVVDYDDALFHRYDRHRWSAVRFVLGKKIDAAMRRSDLVLVGNDYLGERARQAGARRVEWLPTVVDVSRYTVSSEEAVSPLTIGWIGTPNTARYLRLLAPVLRNLVATYDVRVVAVGANTDQLSDLPIEVRPWSEESEVAEIQRFDIGIMPLPDEPFERGKCGYKLIQYMACGKPVVASPVGVNSQIVQDGVNGFLAASIAQWEQYLVILCDNAGLRKRLGSAGRQCIEANFSLQITAPRLAALLGSVGQVTIGYEGFE